MGAERTRHSLLFSALAALVAGTLAVTAAATSAGAETRGASDPGSPATADPDPIVSSGGDGLSAGESRDVLGGAWAASRDVVHVALAGDDGVAILSAREADGYAWSQDAFIQGDPASDDTWIENDCVTSSGRYMAVVFAPRLSVNDESGFSTGGSAAIVDLSTGEISALGDGFSMAYFSPGCGEGDLVTFSQFGDGFETTQLAVVDARTATVTRTVREDGLVSSPVARENGDIVAVRAGRILAFDTANRSRSLVGALAGTVHSLRLDGRGRLAYIATDQRSGVSRVAVAELGTSRSPQTVATGAASSVGIATVGDRFVVTGELATSDFAGVARVGHLAGVGPGATLSSQGSLAVSDKKPEGYGRDAAQAGIATVTAVATRTGTAVEFDVTREAGKHDAGGGIGKARVSAQALASNIAGLAYAGDPNNPIEGERYCAIPRNDPNNQAYQPKPRQVEWAVDRAVKGQLTEARPANWRNLGMPTYTPQGLFPRTTLTGGGTIPQQVVLGVLMQESNLWQASRYTTPGNAGNPLVGNYYGNRDKPSIWVIDYASADCGYGLGQITDGMRIAGHERTDPTTGLKIETALPYNQQRAIALDYEANIAKTVQMLGQKWNELAAAGMLLNNGDANKVENWYFAVWAYNSGFHPKVDATTPWGLGWFNNPINEIYPVGRPQFMLTSQSDAARPQDWPYPEKILGWAAFGTVLTETEYSDPATRTYVSVSASSYRVATWNSDAYRTAAWPAAATFCAIAKNNCDPTKASPCQLTTGALAYHCWWHEPVTWEPSCAVTCGVGFERFSSTYATEASAMASTLPANTLLSSHRADCAAPPAGTVVVDDTTHLDARNSGECSHQSTAGSFAFSFASPDSSGNYQAKVDLHQQGGGFNGHFYFAHMQNASATNKIVTGTWNRGANLNGKWVRVWVHLPDYAAWTQQAGYVIGLGDGTTKTRYLPQRRYQNEWVSLGVFAMKGTPTVTLSSALTQDRSFGSDNLAEFDDVAWDAVGFQQLAAKPTNFVVALGDSYASGEAAGSYEPWSDNNGMAPRSRNACHQSANSWIRKTVLPGTGTSIGAMADTGNVGLDFHALTCSGALTQHVLPYHSVTGTKPANGAGDYGQYGQYGLVSQLDAGYLDENTTLVTLSIGGNDMRFATIVEDCMNPMGNICSDDVIPDSDPSTTSFDDTQTLGQAALTRLATQLPVSVNAVLTQIRTRAPNARIELMAYPRIFQNGAACVLMADGDSHWLDTVSIALNDTLKQVVIARSDPKIRFVSLDTAFAGQGVCGGNGAVSGVVSTLSPGDSVSFFGTGWGVSQQSFHPTTYGTSLYATALQTDLNTP